MKTIDDQNLVQLFATRIFRIPDYQRGYAWKKRQLQELWDDIMDIPQTEQEVKSHFTGTISIRPIRESELKDEEKPLVKDGECFFDVVDGQQRLTTISILLFEIIKKLGSLNKWAEKFIFTGDSPKVFRLGYRATGRGNNNNFLKNKIFEDKDSQSVFETNAYTQNLLDAKEFFGEQLNGMETREVESLFDKVKSCLKFDIKEIDSSYDVQAVFESMNNRGKPLSTLEKLKNRLMFLASRLQKEDLKASINDAWGTIYHEMGKNSEQMLDEDEYLSAHLTLIREPADYAFSEQQTEKKVFEMFCNKASTFPLSYSRNASGQERESDVDYKKINEYVNDIQKFVDYWYKVNFPKEIQDEETQRLVFCIQQLNSSKEIKIFLTQLMSMREEHSGEVTECLKITHRLVKRNAVPGAYAMDLRTLAARARELHSEKFAIKQLREDLKSKCASCDPAAIIDQFKNLFNYVRGAKGFYRWPGLKYFLFEYELNKTPEKDFPPLRWVEDYGKASIEHVIPQNCDKNWPKTMTAYTEGKSLDEDDKKKAKNIIINTLGNLVLIRKEKNSSLSDGSWSDKKSSYGNGTYSEREIAKYSEWNEQSIYERGKKMFDFLCECMLSKRLELKEEQYKEVLFYNSKFLSIPQNSAKVSTASTDERSQG